VVDPSQHHDPALPLPIKSTGISGGGRQSASRTFITTRVNKGVSVYLLASLVCQSNIASKLRCFDVSDDMKRWAVELIG